MNKPLRIALFGFGRIGRNIFRIGFNNPLFEFVAISDLDRRDLDFWGKIGAKKPWQNWP